MKKYDKTGASDAVRDLINGLPVALHEGKPYHN